jgi:hypothetical protein
MNDALKRLEELKKRLLSVVDEYKSLFGKNKPQNNTNTSPSIPAPAETKSESATTEAPAETKSESATTEAPAETKSESATTEAPAETKSESATTEAPAETKSESATTEAPAETKSESATTEAPAETKSEDAKPTLAATTLSGSVGEGGINKPNEVLLVKTLLNKFTPSFNLTDILNSTKVGPTTIEVIKKFQKEKVGQTNPDGRIDVGGKTWKVLNGETPVAVVAEPQAVATGGNFNAAILSAANSLKGMDTSSGPNGGRLACAWAVTKVLKKAGIAPIGSNTNYVPSVVDALNGGRGRKISKAEVLAGDIVIASNIGHIGIAMSNGASQVLSNSSSRAAFRWVSGPDFDGYYGSGSSTFYRVIS